MRWGMLTKLFVLSLDSLRGVHRRPSTRNESVHLFMLLGVSVQKNCVVVKDESRRLVKVVDVLA